VSCQILNDCMIHNQTVHPSIFTNLHIAQLAHQNKSQSFPVELLYFSSPISFKLTKSSLKSRQFPRLEELPFHGPTLPCQIEHLNVAYQCPHSPHLRHVKLSVIGICPRKQHWGSLTISSLYPCYGR
jgi:hypothetical protein